MLHKRSSHTVPHTTRLTGHDITHSQYSFPFSIVVVSKNSFADKNGSYPCVVKRARTDQRRVNTISFHPILRTPRSCHLHGHTPLSFVRYWFTARDLVFRRIRSRPPRDAQCPGETPRSGPTSLASIRAPHVWDWSRAAPLASQRQSYSTSFRHLES